MLKKWLIPVGIFIIANYVIKKYMMAQRLDFAIRKINFNNNFLAPQLLITVAAINSVNSTATVKDFNADVFVNNTKIGTVENNDMFVINANDVTDFDLIVKLNAVATIVTVLQIFKQWGGSVKLVGSSTIDGIKVPVNIKYDL